jgi:gamma-glutamylcyclotransferase
MKFPRFTQLLPIGPTPSLSPDLYYPYPTQSPPFDMSFSIPNQYFAYGSNLWIEQMEKRCPHSILLGLGRLRGWHWIINERQYANVVKITMDDPLPLGSEPEVWGSVWQLSEDDFDRLDEFEGASTGCYKRSVVEVDFWIRDDSSQMLLNRERKGGQKGVQPRQMDAWLYFDPWRVNSSTPQYEYIHRMNSGILDAVSLGMPESYVNNVMRQYIPDMKIDPDIQTYDEVPSSDGCT